MAIPYDAMTENMKKAHRRMLLNVNKQLTIAGLNMERRSKNRAFSQFNNRTGRLRASIGFRVSGPDGRFGRVQGTPRVDFSAGGSFGSRFSGAGKGFLISNPAPQFGDDVAYAKFIEFGTSHIRPRLFLGRSVQAERPILRAKLGALLAVSLNIETGPGPDIT